MAAECHFQFWRMSPKGEVMWNELGWMVNNSPICNFDHKPLQVYHVYITEQCVFVNHLLMFLCEWFTHMVFHLANCFSCWPCWTIGWRYIVSNKICARHFGSWTICLLRHGCKFRFCKATTSFWSVSSWWSHTFSWCLKPRSDGWMIISLRWLNRVRS